MRQSPLGSPCVLLPFVGSKTTLDYWKAYSDSVIHHCQADITVQG